jgi:hypothetical protein
MIHALRRYAGNPGSGNPYYEPVLFCRYDCVDQVEKMLLAFAVMVVGLFQGQTLERGSLLHGRGLTLTMLRLRSHLEQVQHVLQDLEQLAMPHASVPAILNSHCRDL